MRPVTPGEHPPIDPTRRDVRDARGSRDAIEQEVVVRRTVYGDQIVVRRVMATEPEGRSRTLHIDAVVR